MKIIARFIIPILVLFLGINPLLAEVMSSSNYIMERDNFNTGGGLTTGVDYSLESTIGQPVSGQANDSNYIANQGYQQGIVQPIAGPVCGNGICEVGENSSNCPADCSSSPPPPPPTLTISEVGVTNTNINSADISWVTDSSATCKLSWGVDTNYSLSFFQEVVSALTHTVAVTGLTPDTGYYFKIECNGQNGASASSLNNQFTTLSLEEEVPNVINLRAEAGDTTVSLFWVNPTADNFSGVIVKRAIGFFPNIEQGTEVYSGSGESFTDSGLTNEITYYYSVFSYDSLGNFSTGVSISATPIKPVEECATLVVTNGTVSAYPDCSISCNQGFKLNNAGNACIATEEEEEEELPFELPPPSDITPSAELYFSDFDFFQKDSLFEPDNDLVNLEIDNNTLVVLPAEKVLSGVEKIILNLSTNGKTATYIFSLSDNGDWQAYLPSIINPDSYFATIILLDDSDRTIKALNGRLIFSETEEIEENIITGLIDTSDKLFRQTLNPLTEIAKSPAGQVGAGVVAVLSALNLIVAAPWWNLWYLLQFLFTQPFTLFLKRKGWGTVYNSITKMPVGLALVRLYDVKTGRLVASRVTDKDGRYIFLVDAGEYYLEASKAGFQFPSTLLKKINDDGNYFDLYYGEQIKIDEKSAIVANIPLDQEDVKISNEQAIKEFQRKKVFGSLSLVGPIIAFGYMLVFPSWYSIILMTIHLLLFVYFRRAVESKSLVKWGKVFDCNNKKPLNKAVTRIFSSEYGKMLEYYVTDSYGRYGFLVGNNKYYVTADKEGYQTAKTPIIDLTKEEESKVLAKDLGLVKDDPDKQNTVCEVEAKTPEIENKNSIEKETKETEIINNENREKVVQKSDKAKPKAETIIEAENKTSVRKEDIFG